jgi:hypothetical protein
MPDVLLPEFKLRLEAMRTLLSELDETIVNSEVRDYFLSAPKKHLRDIDRFLADTKNQTSRGFAGFALALTEEQLAWVKKLVTKYGPNIQISGG